MRGVPAEDGARAAAQASGGGQDRPPRAPEDRSHARTRPRVRPGSLPQPRAELTSARAPTTTALLATATALAFVRAPLIAHRPALVRMAAATSTKRSASPIDLGSTDEDEPAPKRAASTSAAASLPAGASTLRGVPVPNGWSVHGGSLLARSFSTFTPSTKVAAFDFDGCACLP